MQEDFKATYFEIGELLREERKKAGLTQQQLADKINKLDRSKISDIENGKEDFQFSTLIKIFVALNLAIDLKIKPKKNK